MPVRGLLFDLGRTIALFAPLLAAGVSAADAQSGANPGYSAFAPCDGGMECGHVIAPKNYLNASDGIANITLSRRNATSLPRKGSVFVNPGGPGAPGSSWVVDNIDHLVSVIGTQWDIVGFDPRGIGSTTPGVHCFANVQDQIALYTNTVFEQGYTLPNMLNTSDPANRAALVPQEREHLAIFKAQSEACQDNMDVTDLRFMGTTTVARDVDFMAKVLDGENGKINFYGYSYGTVIGNYIINMFPHRVGYITIDGVVDPITVSRVPTNEWTKTFLRTSEGSYEWFLRDCSKAGPAACPLANHNGEDPTAIGVRIDTFTQALVAAPLAVSAIRNVFVNALYSPSTWPAFAGQLAAAMGPAADGTDLLEALRNGTAGTAAGDLSRFGVICADAPRNASLTPADYADALLAAFAVSRFAGGLTFTDVHACARTAGVSSGLSSPSSALRALSTRRSRIRNATLAHPILIVSNTEDPVTPLVNGLATNARMGANSSTLVIQNGPGHTSLALPSNCTTQNIRAYWAGHVPVNGTTCELSAGPWPSQTD